MEPEIYRQMREVEDFHWWFSARRSIIAKVLDSLKLPPAARILDVGSGTGGNLEMLSRFGTVTGIESDDMALNLSSSRKIAKVLKGSIPDDLPGFTEEFDLIIMLDVLEHIDDDSAALSCLGQLLAPNGVLVVTVPAFPSLWSDHDIQHHHKRRYRYSTLKNVLDESGLRLRHMTYYNTWLFPVIAAVRLFRKIMPSGATGRDVRVPSPLVNGVLKSLFASERSVVSRLKLPFGTSLLAVAERFEQDRHGNG